jgi:hypothetical protein
VEELIEPTRHIGGLGKHYGTGQPEFYFESSVAEKVYLDMLREAGVEVVYGERVEKADLAKERYAP